MSEFGFVVIGRNEGDRLIRCLTSLKNNFSKKSIIVYVDSGSTDGSIESAQAIGADVICLDQSQPFTMARGRNTGLNHLHQSYPDIQYVQFIDGDCELFPGWIEQALSVIANEPSLAIVCGRRRERFPKGSVYNLLADMEWNTPVGETTVCGGDALARISAILAVNAYNPAMICGEEPEMCIRLRRQGWTIRRIDVDMTKHDLDMHYFGQWWKRMMRSGWSIAEGFAMYGKSEERYMVREYYSGWLWGVCIPAVAIVLAYPSHGISLLLLLTYLYLGCRIYSHRWNHGDRADMAGTYALFCTVSKFPQVIGQIKYLWAQFRKQPVQLIEYKNSPQ